MLLKYSTFLALVLGALACRVPSGTHFTVANRSSTPLHRVRITCLDARFSPTAVPTADEQTVSLAPNTRAVLRIHPRTFSNLVLSFAVEPHIYWYRSVETFPPTGFLVSATINEDRRVVFRVSPAA